MTHPFYSLDNKQLKQIIKKYNLEVKINNYSKLNKHDLITEMRKHLKVNEEGKIKLKKRPIIQAQNNINTEYENLFKKIEEVKIKKDEFIKEHENLIGLLNKFSDNKEIKQEAEKQEEELEQVETPIKKLKEKRKKYVREELENMKIKDLKELIKKLKISLTYKEGFENKKKDKIELIGDILAKQNKAKF
jgi:uncharacterized protein YdiU (UPF0061 family)